MGNGGFSHRGIFIDESNLPFLVSKLSAKIKLYMNKTPKDKASRENPIRNIPKTG
jgi:hypothetical protein